jgi:hypothetical protein
MGGMQGKKERTLEDLKGILNRVARKYLGRLLPEVSVKWGRYRKPKESRKDIYLGWYLYETKVIQIHPVLRQSWVPTYFVEYVVYHEVLHHVMSPEMKRHALRAAKSGQKKPNFHPEVFLLAEKLFKKYDRARQWEEKNYYRLCAA